MKKMIFCVAAAFLLASALLVSGPVKSALAVPMQDQEKQTEDVGLEFNFNKADWSTVVQWYADQAGFVLEPVDKYPLGTFSLVSDVPLSPVDAIDEINHKLRLSDPPMTLLRNGSRLYLVAADREIQEELVETIDVRDLDKRGKYEPLRVVFDVSGLDIEETESQIKQRVKEYNLDFVHTYPDANQISVRESGENLRFIRDVIIAAKQNLRQYSSYQLKHLSAEMFLEQLSPFLNLDDEYKNEDETLIIAPDLAPGSRRLILRGTPKLIQEVKDAASQIDVAPVPFETIEGEKRTLQQYLVPNDSKETFQVIDQLLYDAGRGARVIQGSETGKITVLGTKADHEQVEEVLALESGGGGFAVIHIVNGEADDILIAVQSLMGITAETLADGPTMIANTIRNYIMVRGTPPQVAEAKNFIEQIDKNEVPSDDGLRTTVRALPMSPEERDRILDNFPDLWPTTGRNNPLELGRPFDIRRPKSSDSDQRSLLRKKKTPNTTKRGKQLNSEGALINRDRINRVERFDVGLIRDHVFVAANCAFPQLSAIAASGLIQSADEPSPGDIQNDDYQPPVQVESVPGAPIRIWGTPYGIMIESADLDAGDDAEFLIQQQRTEESEIAVPTIYQLKHCEASYMKSLIETVYGLESSDGGGGSGLLNGIASNVMGDAGAGMVDSLFGGGGGGSGASTLEGEVTVESDNRLNYLIVIGATQADLGQIDGLVEAFDVSTAPQDPETSGQIFEIEVLHRDPEEIKERVETLLEVYFKDEQANQGGGGGNESANIARMMRQLTQGGRGGGGGGSTEEVKMRGYLDVDAKTSKLLFMGPMSIFRQVEAVVIAIDLPEVKEPLVSQTVDLGELEANDTLKKLKALLGESKFVDGITSEEDEAATEKAAEGQQRNGQNGNRRTNTQQNNQQRAADAAARSRLQQLFRGGNFPGGNNRGRGQNNRGGNNRGRGGGR